MSEEKTQEGQEASSEETSPETNLKHEMQRKYGNLEKGLSDTNQKLEQLMQSLTTISQQNQQAQAPAESEDDLEDLMYKNPKAYAAKIKEQTLAEIEKKQAAQAQQQAESQKVISTLVSDFPELNQPNSELYEKTQELYNNMSESEKASPATWRAVVYQAAMETGLKPKKLRKKETKSSETDDFVMSANAGRSPAKKEVSIDDNTLKFARLMGLDVDNKETVARLQKRANRDFRDYE